MRLKKAIYTIVGIIGDVPVIKEEKRQMCASFEMLVDNETASRNRCLNRVIIPVEARCMKFQKESFAILKKGKKMTAEGYFETRVIKDCRGNDIPFIVFNANKIYKTNSH